MIRTEEVAKGFRESGKGAEWQSGRGGSEDTELSTRDTQLFSNLTVQIDRGDRVGILGPNGSGKTTLLRVLVGELKPDTGSVRFGTGVQLAYFDQQLTSVDPTVDAVEAVRQQEYRSKGDAPFARGRGTDMTPGQARGLLARFGISGDLALQTVGHMSGGERTKVALARMHALGPNVMFLDEPTNHLDLWSCAALEKVAAGVRRDGAVRQSRPVLHRQRGDEGARVRGGSLADSRGELLGLSAFRGGDAGGCCERQSGREERVAKWQRGKGTRGIRARLAATRQGSAPSPASKSSVAKSSAAKSSKRRRKFTYRKLEEIESDIAHEESLIARLEVDLADPNVHRDADRMLRVQSRLRGGPAAAGGTAGALGRGG